MRKHFIFCNLTTFEAANAVKEAGEAWSGRDLTWGDEEGLLVVNSHAFIDFNAFFSPMARGLFFVMNQAKQLRLDHRGAPLSIARRPDGHLTVEARVMRSEGFYCYVEAFTLDKPQGERREIIVPPINRKISGYQPGGAQILTADDPN